MTFHLVGSGLFLLVNMATWTERLANIDAAIDEIIANGFTTSYSINNRSATTSDLPAVMEARDRIAVLAAKESKGISGARTRRVIPVG